MSCNPTNSCSSSVPTSCEALPTTNAAARLVVEDEANCKKTITAPENPSLLLQTETGSAQWADGSSAKPINLPELKDSVLGEGIVVKNANGDIAELVHTAEETEDEILMCDDTGWKKKTASEIFGTGTGVPVRVAGGPATWINGDVGEILHIASDGSIEFGSSNIQSGTTAQRPSDPMYGTVYYNTTMSIFEWYDGTQWMTASSQRRSDEVVQSFLTSTTFTVPDGITNISEVLVVGGGGGGGSAFGGGGGGGGVIYSTNYAVTSGAEITVTIGAGGTGGICTPTNTAATNGGNSVFGSLIAIGGGAGGGYNAGSATSGGSGGGGRDGGGGGSGTSGQGYAGGTGYTNVGGGGGGATQPGQNAASSTTGANGGNGFLSTISGSVAYYGGGGGSGGSSSQGTGGLGGGVAGVNGATPSAAANNTGGGGGGSCNTSYNTAYRGGAGGSGIVIIKY